MRASLKGFAAPCICTGSFGSLLAVVHLALLLEIDLPFQFFFHVVGLRSHVHRARQALVLRLWWVRQAIFRGVVAAHARYLDTTIWVAAVRSGDAAFIRALVDSGEDVEQTLHTSSGYCLGRYTCRAIHLAAALGNASAVRMLVTLGADIEATDQLSFTAIIAAAHEGQEATVRVLGELGANVDAVIGVEALTGGSLSRRRSGMTATMIAAQRRHAPTIRVLAGELGANVEAANPEGWTAFLYAAAAADIAGLRALAEAGADTTASCALPGRSTRKKHKHTAMDLCGRGRRDNAREEIERCKRWLARSVDWQPLHYACDSRRAVASLAALLRGGADPMLPSKCGESPLDLCRLEDPDQGALPEDPATTQLLEEALRPWHPERHRLFPRSFSRRVVIVLLLHQRLEWQAWHARRRRQRGPLALTKEVWLGSVVPLLPRFGPGRA